MAPTRILILAGTSQARALCEALAGRHGVEATASLAGRTREPQALPLPTRHGGFGGADGLAAYLQEFRTDLLIDATHPFATQISANAVAACDAAHVPRLAFDRDPWRAGEGDRWSEVDSLESAADALGQAPRRVFLSQGRLGVAAFRAHPQHAYVMRSVDDPEAKDLPQSCKVLLARGPFQFGDEVRLLAEERIDVIVAKNGGGPSAKVDAARALGLPMVMVRMPARPPGERVIDLKDALAWIEAHRRAP